MKTTGDLVGILVELTPGMQLGHDHLGGGNALRRVNVHRHSPAIVDDFRRAVRMQDDGCLIGVTSQRLVDCVINGLIDHVMQARTVIGVADIHAGTFAHSLKALQDLDRIRAIFVLVNSISHNRISKPSKGT